MVKLFAPQKAGTGLTANHFLLSVQLMADRLVKLVGFEFPSTHHLLKSRTEQ